MVKMMKKLQPDPLKFNLEQPLNPEAKNTGLYGDEIESKEIIENNTLQIDDKT